MCIRDRPHSNIAADSHDSLSRPGSPPAIDSAANAGSSSQKMHETHGSGRPWRRSSVSEKTSRPTPLIASHPRRSATPSDISCDTHRDHTAIPQKKQSGMQDSYQAYVSRGMPHDSTYPR